MEGINIITPGDLRRFEKYKRFICKDCGCVWEAGASKYRYVGTQWEGDSWECRCPTCGKYCYTEE
jgi:RNase P subunit RPR2